MRSNLVPALAVLGLAGTLGTAHAAPIVATSTLIWNAPTPGDPSGTGPERKALPAAFPVSGKSDHDTG